MDDQVRIVSDEEFIVSVVDRAETYSCECQRDRKFFKEWLKRLDLLEEGMTPDENFFRGFVVGGAIVGLDIAGFKMHQETENSSPGDISKFQVLRGGKETL